MFKLAFLAGTHFLSPRFCLAALLLLPITSVANNSLVSLTGTERGHHFVSIQSSPIPTTSIKPESTTDDAKIAWLSRYWDVLSHNNKPKNALSIPIPASTKTNIDSQS